LTISSEFIALTLQPARSDARDDEQSQMSKLIILRMIKMPMSIHSRQQPTMIP